MKKYVSVLLLLLIACLFSVSALAAELPEELTAQGYRMENGVLYLPEGWETMGLIPLRDENGEICDYEDAADGMLDGYWFSENGISVSRIVFPSSMKKLGYESILFLSADEIILNEGLEEMDAPFLDVVAKRIVIPSTVQNLDGSTLSNAAFDEIIIADDNPYYCIRDGVIFSSDMKTLVSYPEDRTDLHYTVPAGVESIGPWAFSECNSLQSVSLPVGLKSIGWGAFASCGRLISISVPLTVTAIDRYAFSNCVSLTRVSLPVSLQYLLDSGDPEAEDNPNVFYNCSALGLGYEGDNGHTESVPVPDEEYILSYGDWRPVIASPAKASEGIALYSKPDRSSPVLFRFASGTVFHAVEESRTWANRNQPESPFVMYSGYDDVHGSFTGYIQRSDLVFLPDTAEPLFEYATIRIRSGKHTLYPSKGTYGSPSTVRIPAINDLACSIDYTERNTPWVHVLGNLGDDWIAGYVFVGDCDLTRVTAGDGKKYGIVVASELGNRVHLREKADRSSRSLARYFSGTQLEITGQKGDFYHVLIGETEGYMMKEYVRVVPEE